MDGWFWILLLVSRFFVFSFTFLFIVVGHLNTLNGIYLGGKLGSWRSGGGSMGLLGRFCCRWGLDWTNNPINKGFLVGSMLERGAWGIKSYSVPEWEYTKSRYWAQLMAWSLITTPPIATSQAIGGNKYLVNQSTKSWFGIGSLMSLLHLLHSWIWSEICVEVFWCREVKRSVSVS